MGSFWKTNPFANTTANAAIFYSTTEYTENRALGKWVRFVEWHISFVPLLHSGAGVSPVFFPSFRSALSFFPIVKELGQPYPTPHTMSSKIII
jgi:hypothetical protein